MAITGIRWGDSTQTDDIHVLRGRSSRNLDNLLILDRDPPATPFFANDAAAKLAENITVEFLPPSFAPGAAPGVAVNTATGVVTPTAAIPAGPYPRNFIIKATVRIVGAANPLFVIPIRVHVHSAVTAVHLTPPSLTVREPDPAPMAASTVSFSVFAEFDAGGGAGNTIFADITRFGDSTVPASRLTWQVVPPGGAAPKVSVDADGKITALVALGSDNVQVTLPAELGGGVDTAQVIIEDRWSTPRTAKAATGSASTTPTANILNLLLLPDGFIAGEQTKFEQQALSFLTRLRASPTVAPYDTMPMNVFTVWVPSQERGTTVRNHLRYLDRTNGKRRAEVLPTPEEPPAGRVPRIQKVEELLFQVGLPTPAEAATPLATKVADWNALYAAGQIGVVSPAIYQQWTDMADYTLAFERNTAFGTATGGPPQVLSPDDGRVAQWHPGRTQRADVDKMLTALVDTTGTNIGATWTAGLGRVSVAVVAAGGRYAGARVPAPNEMIFTSLNNSNETLLADIVGRQIPALRSSEPKARMPLTTVAILTHESGHGLTLGDEYGGQLTAAGTKRDNARKSFPNLQDDADVRDATGIRGSLISWQFWPRISTAGVVVAAVSGVNPNYDVTIRTDPRSTFAVNDVVRLRHRPFYGQTAAPIHLEYLPESIDFTVQTITPTAAGIKLRLVRLAPGPFNAGDWIPQQAILFRPQGTFMVHEKVVQSINNTHAPLNRTAAVACAVDERLHERLAAAVPGLDPNKQPKIRAWIVGLYDGGGEFHCGIFHARGACMMRGLQVRSRKKRGILYNFCPVCRYVIVDFVDPALHGQMDAEYAKIYPVATP